MLESTALVMGSIESAFESNDIYHSTKLPQKYVRCSQSVNCLSGAVEFAASSNWSVVYENVRICMLITFVINCVLGWPSISQSARL